MTEAGWLGCDDPFAMLTSYRAEVSERKLRLFACAAARTVWHFLEDPRSRVAIDVAEQFAEGQATVSTAVVTGEAALEAERGYQFGTVLKTAAASATSTLRAFVAMPEPDVCPAALSARMCAKRAANAIATARGEQNPGGGSVKPEKEMIPLLRDIFGNPFRPVSVDHTWLSSTVVALAGGIYEERAFDRLPILADALMDAGCDDEQVLTHCRDTGPHVRGCWVVDLLLGKA